MSTGLVQSWLDDMRLPPQVLENYRTSVKTLFSLAESRGYLRKGANPMDGTEAIKMRNHAKIEIFTAVEVTKLLAAAPADFLPLLAIGTFAGVRVAEVRRLDWADENLVTGFITVAADIAKTARPLHTLPSQVAAGH